MTGTATAEQLGSLLAHLGLPTEVPQPQPPPARAADLFSDIPA